MCEITFSLFEQLVRELSFASMAAQPSIWVFDIAIKSRNGSPLFFFRIS